jgi:hypothetical protein
MFNFTDIQTGRQLEEVEVNQINFIMKRRQPTRSGFIPSAKFHRITGASWMIVTC